LKLVVAVVKPFRLADVIGAAMDAGATGATVTESRGFGRQGGHAESYRGSEYRIELVPKSYVELIVDDEDVDAVVDAVVAAARTGKIGDGKVWVRDLDAVQRIRTGETGPDAIAR
jgi:nitrogen regulatory protein P-II 1